MNEHLESCLVDSQIGSLAGGDEAVLGLGSLPQRVACPSLLGHAKSITKALHFWHRSAASLGASGLVDSVDPVLIAALGDVHGQWRQAAGLVISAYAQAGVEPSYLAMILQVGDAEPLRSEAEIVQVPGPKHYRKLGDFPEVMSGDIVIPAPTFFIAGNHEPFASLDAGGGLIEG